MAKASRACSTAASRPAFWSNPLRSLTRKAAIRRPTMADAARKLTTDTAIQFEHGMRSLRVLARLLDYPTAPLQSAVDELIEALYVERRLPDALKAELMSWCQHIYEADLLELQSEYVALFDKGRAHSLLLFEHVHGESRDRGQAMVDLIDVY